AHRELHSFPTRTLFRSRGGGLHAPLAAKAPATPRRPAPFAAQDPHRCTQTTEGVVNVHRRCGAARCGRGASTDARGADSSRIVRSEEHTSELQSRENLV